jgi:hypothetical protein
MPRWITITKAPFDYRWPTVTAMTHFSMNGEFFVKDEVADFAISKGYATEGKASGSTTKSVKGKATKPRKSAKPKSDAKAAPADAKPDDQLDGARLAGDDRLDAGRVVDPVSS